MRGLEPLTFGLGGRRSTIEPHRLSDHNRSKSNLSSYSHWSIHQKISFVIVLLEIVLGCLDFYAYLALAAHSCYLSSFAQTQHFLRVFVLGNNSSQISEDSRNYRLWKWLKYTDFPILHSCTCR